MRGFETFRGVEGRPKSPEIHAVLGYRNARADIKPDPCSKPRNFVRGWRHRALRQPLIALPTPEDPDDSPTRADEVGMKVNAKALR